MPQLTMTHAALACDQQGLCISIQGPTLMDLIDILHVNQDMMSYSLAYAGLAYSFGGFLSEYRPLWPSSMRNRFQ